MLKVDFHTHTSDDPLDFIPYTAAELVDRASALGFDALAITLHDRQRDVHDVAAYARARGVVLIRGVERTIQGRHVLLLNFPSAAESIENFDELATLKAKHPDSLVVAPHPFYPASSCLGSLLDRHESLFDAVELNAFYTSSVDFNRAAVRWAQTHRKPIVGNSDAHRLSLVGTTCSLVDAGRTADEICTAVKHGCVQIQTRPLSVVEAGTYFARIAFRALHLTRLSSPVPETA